MAENQGDFQALKQGTNDAELKVRTNWNATRKTGITSQEHSSLAGLHEEVYAVLSRNHV